MEIEKLTKEMLLKAGMEGRRVDGYVYICANQEDGVRIVVNSATPDTFCSMNNVLAWLSAYGLREGHIVYSIANGEHIGQYDVDEFASYFNKRYAEYFVGRIEKIVSLINGLNLDGVTARKAGDSFILEVDGLLGESFSSLPEMSECLNVRSRNVGSEYLDEVDHAICDAAKKAGLL